MNLSEEQPLRGVSPSSFPKVIAENGTPADSKSVEIAAETTPDQTMELSTVERPRADDEDNHEDEQELKNRRRSRYIRYAVGLFLLAFLAFVIADSQTNSYIKTGMNSFLQWVEANPGGGVLVFMLVIFCTTLLFIPGIILTFGSGYVFANAFGLGVGVLLGTIAVFIGASAGAIVSFLLGRFLLRDCVAGLTQKFKLFEALDKAMEEKGFRIMLLLRLSPVIFASPYLNYGAGGMAISFWAYVLSLFAILPGAVMFVFLGASAGSLADSSGGGNSQTTTIVLVVGIVFSVFAVALTTYYARVELRKVTAAAAAENNYQQEESTAAADNNVVVDEEMGQTSGVTAGNETGIAMGSTDAPHS